MVLSLEGTNEKGEYGSMKGRLDTRSGYGIQSGKGKEDSHGELMRGPITDGQNVALTLLGNPPEHAEIKGDPDYKTPDIKSFKSIEQLRDSYLAPQVRICTLV